MYIQGECLKYFKRSEVHFSDEVIQEAAVRIQNLMKGAKSSAILGKGVAISILLVAFHGVVLGESPRVISTGDSLTGQYYRYLPQAFNNLGVTPDLPNPVYSPSGDTICTSRGGLSSSLYVGKSACSLSESKINYAANVLAADPDAILFMLGINDISWGSDVESRFSTYKANISTVFDSFANFSNSKGQHPKVIIGSILPFDCNKNEAYWTQVSGSPMLRQFDALDTVVHWNSWLQQQSQQHGFEYLDNFSSIQQIPDWNTSLLAEHDGLHLSERGSQWVASQFANATIVPEPSSIILLMAGAFGFFAWGWRRNRHAV
jgi:lysophospholipase L1-like esterase